MAQTNWLQTKPNPVANTKCQNATGAAPGGYAVVVTSQSSESGKDFGNTRFGLTSQTTNSAFQLVDDLSPWAIGDFEILLNPSNTIVATNPGQFYYHQRATTSAATASMQFTINWPCQFVPRALSRSTHTSNTPGIRLTRGTTSRLRRPETLGPTHPRLRARLRPRRARPSL